MADVQQERDNDDEYLSEGGDEEVMEEEADGQYARQRRGPGWLPPGADCGGKQPLFGHDLERHFWIPPRLADKTHSLVEAVNDFHYAMMNDLDRNEFYRKALEKCVSKGKSVVVEIGTGSGLLAMLASQAGAKQVYAIEASRHMAQLARVNITNNKMDNVEVINKLSTDASTPEDIPEKADILISEIIGTLLLGESALEYVTDVRERMLKPDAVIIPAAGCQFVELIECNDLEHITSVKSWNGLDLSAMNILQDTVSCVFTKQYGFRMNSVPYKRIVERTCVADVDFYEHSTGHFPVHSKIRVKAQASGRIHAVMLYWEAYADRERTIKMSTDPRDTVDNFPRDLQWGQALQLVEEQTAGSAVRMDLAPVPFVVEEGEELDLVVRFSDYDNAVLQITVDRVVPRLENLSVKDK
mmetsp:Transcript_19506/g.54849  ORF Transcript_19506/g.54849 Transcript_19506/m.54849 type:complete len:413 (-) Transcript_19506:1618-2856(-)